MLSKRSTPTVAIVGCGRVSRYHFSALSKLRDVFELSAVCDIDKDAAEAAAKVTGAPVSTFEELLERRPDLVVLATPSGLHAEQAIRAMNAGCHVLTEKPMATRWEDAIQMNRTSQTTGRSLWVVKQQRYLPTVSALRDAIQAGKMGRIFGANLNVLWRRPQAYYDLAQWRGTYAQDGGAMMNQAIHYIDLLQWLVGPVESVQSYAATLARNIEVEDTLSSTLKFRSGALGTISVTTLAHPDSFGCNLTVFGERGIVGLGGQSCDEITHWGIETAEPEQTRSDSYVYGSGHYEIYKDIYQVLVGGVASDMLVTGTEGARSLEIVLASYRASAEGRKTSLPL